LAAFAAAAGRRPLHAPRTPRVEHLRERAERRVRDGKARVRDGLRRGDRQRVPVERDQAPARTEPLEDQAAVSAPPEGAVHVRPVRPDGERLERLGSQDG
jgi:hypothetical protein